MDNPITVPLPQDVPTDWVYGQTVAPSGPDVGLAEQYGFNYLGQQVNAAQQAAQEVGEAIPDLVQSSDIGQPNGVAELDENGKVPSTQLPAMDYLPLAGGTMSGPINMNNQAINNLPTPQQSAQPLRKIDGVSSATASLYGLGSDAVPDDIFKSIMQAQLIIPPNSEITSASAESPSGKTYVGVYNSQNETWVIQVSEYGTYDVTVQLSSGRSQSVSVFLDNCKQYTVYGISGIFGVAWDGTSTTKWARIDGSANFSDPSPAVNNGTGSSPFDNILPWSGMVKSTDELGNVLVAIPKFWYKWTSLSNNGLQLEIANYAAEGFSVSPAHMDRGDGQGERDVIYVGRYPSDSNYKSTTGVLPAHNISIQTARSGITGLGDNIYMLDVATRATIQMLYLVEFADWNSQATIGYGASTSTSSVVNTGGTDAMQYHTGTAALTRDTPGYCQYRNIESLWDNLTNYLEGYNVANENIQIILNPSNFGGTGTVVAPAIMNEGFPTAFGISQVEGYEWYIYPTELGGSYTTYTTDDMRINGNNAKVGGSYSSGSTGNRLEYGLFFQLNSSTIYDTDGCRLMKLPNNA